MIWPTLCVDNFLDNPDEILELSEKLTYEPIDNAPGTRSQSIHLYDSNFFDWICKKMISLYYPNDIDNIKYYATGTFQKVPANLKYDNWVHADDNYEITSILYLNKHTDSGTSIFHKRKFNYQGIQYSNEKNKYFKDNIETKDIKKFKNLNNDTFEETMHVKGRFNRLMMFDSSHFHASQPYIDKNNRDRLTLIIFFKKIILNDIERSHLPIIKSKRI